MSGSFAKLLVADVDRSLAFYIGLGFRVSQRDDVFVQLHWGDDELWLVRTPSGRSLEGARGVGVLICFRSEDPSVDTLATMARALGAAVAGPVDQPWHTRELVVTDPDGYRVNFLQSAWSDA